MGYFQMLFRSTCIPAGVLTFASLCVANPGFGTVRKKEIALNTRQPAVVRLANTSLAFTGKFSNPEYSSVKDSLLATLATELLSNEKTLVVKDKPSEAEWVVSVDVTGYSVPRSQQRTEGSGTSTIRYTRWVGSLNAAYQVLDRNGRVHDASNVESTYDQEFSSTGTFGHLPFGLGRSVVSRKAGTKPQSAPATPDEVKQLLVKDIVSQIALKLGNTSRTIQVRVAGGDDHLERAVDFMAQELWSRASDELQAMHAFEKPDDESYRQYDLGLVYEAIAYDSKTSREQRANIFKASEYYDKALELNPKQKYFVETVARSRDAIARFKELDAMQLADKKAAQKHEAPKPAEVKTAAKTVTAFDVIEMYKAGVGEEQLKDFIRNSPLEFNPYDKDTLLAVAKARLPISIQNEMRKKIGAPPLSTPTETAIHKSARRPL